MGNSNTSSNRRAGRLVASLFLVAMVVICAGGGVYVFHKHRRQAAAQEAIEAGVTAYNAAQYTRAAINLGKYLIVDPQNTDILYKYAVSQLYRRPQEKDSAAQAISALEAIARIQPNDANALSLLTEMYLSARDAVSAERVAREWRRVSPEDPQAGQMLATAFLLAGRKDDARKTLEEVLKRHPDQVRAASTLAALVLLPDRRNLQEATKLLDAAVVASPTAAIALLARGRFCLGTGQFKRAREDIEAAEHLESSNSSDILELGVLLEQIGFHQRATAAFDRAEKLAPADPKVYLSRGQLALDSGDTTGGSALVDRLLAAPLGERRLDLLPMSVELYLAANRISDAKRVLEQLKEGEASSEIVSCNEAAIGITEGRIREAIPQLEGVVHRYPGYSRAHLILARAYSSTEDFGRAADCYRRYLDLAGTSLISVNEQLALARVYARLGRWPEAARVASDTELQAPFRPGVLLTSIEMKGYVARPKGAKPDPDTITGLLDRIKRLGEELKKQSQPEDSRVQILFARLTAWVGQEQRACQLLQPLAEQPLSRVPALLALLEIEEDAGRLDQAIGFCKVAMESSSKDQLPDLQVRLIELYIEKGDAANSEKLVRELVGQGPGRSGRQIHLAQMLFRRNRPKEARAVLVKTIEQDSRDTPSRLMLLNLLSATDQNPSRQDMVDQLRKLQGENGEEWRVWQARIWLDRDDWSMNRSKAESLLKLVIETDPVSQEALFWLGFLYERCGASDQALAMYRRAFEANTSDQAVAARYLAAASRAQHWTEADRVLTALPEDDPVAQEYRISGALRRGDAQQAEQLLRARADKNSGDFQSRLQLASILLSRNAVPEATKLLEKAARIAPDRPEVLTARVHVCLGRSEWDQAIALCNQALAKTTMPEAFALRASAEDAAGHFAEAEADLQRVSQIEGWEERGHVAIGQLYARHAQIDKALEKWRAGLSILPKSIAVRREIARALLGSDQKAQQEEGMKLVAGLLAESPDDQSLLLMQADAVAHTNPSKAEGLYREVIQRHSAASEAYGRLSQIAFDGGQMEKALELLDQGLAQTPSDLDLLLMKAQLLQPNSIDRAIATAREAANIAQSMLNSEPNNQRLALILARAQSLAGAPGNAMASLNNSLVRADAPQAIGLRLAMADLQLQRKDFEDADEQIAQASRLAPGDPRPVQLRIRSLGARGAWSAIDAVVRDYLKDHPDDYSVTFSAVSQFMASSDVQYYPSAISLCERLLKRLPDDAAALKALGLAYYNLGRIPEAKEAFQRGVRSHPTDAGLVNNLCWILCEHDGNPEEAERLAATVLTSGRSEPDYYTQLDTWGVIQYRLGIKAKAAKQQDDARRHLSESRSRLEECLRQQAIDAGTRAQATLHLARTLSQLDNQRSYELLKNLLGPDGRGELLSAEERKESRALFERLSVKDPTKTRAGV